MRDIFLTTLFVGFLALAGVWAANESGVDTPSKLVEYCGNVKSGKWPAFKGYKKCP